MVPIRLVYGYLQGFGVTSGGAGALLVSELDPDAPTRQRRRLDSENAKGEEMLTAHLWKLVRAGRKGEPSDREIAQCQMVEPTACLLGPQPC